LAGILQLGRTSYYAWLRNREVAEKLKEHLKKRIEEEFAESRDTYGPDRIIAELRITGERLGRVKCRNLMEEMSLTSCHNRHITRSLTNSKKARGDGYPNILREQELPIGARMGLTSDITYLKTAEGFMYHCVIRDIVTGDVLGDHMADRMTKELVINAILGMLARHDLAKGCIFHSDRCNQYTSKP
jgi:putative transposase